MSPTSRGYTGQFRLPQLPKEDYQGLQWSRERLGEMVGDPVGQWETVCTGLRLLALFLKGAHDPVPVDPSVPLALLQEFRAGQRVKPPHA